MRFRREHKKFLVAFRNEKLFVNTTTKGTFLDMSAYLKISGQPQLRFLSMLIAIEKLINAEGLILVKLTRVSIQDSQSCCTFQDVSRL
jgi:hypothetical protein